jgi:hypothetical protein
MNDAAAATKSAKASRSPRTRSDDAAPGASQRFLPGAAIIIAGALITAGIATAALTPGLMGTRSSAAAGYEEPTLSALAPGEIAAAVPTLDPATSQAVVADAKSCKAPLAWVALVKRAGTPSSMVRIRSGAYLSPAFQVTSAPQRIAIPYPAPYSAGRGVLSLVGDATDLWFYLTPGWFIEALNGSASINVVWTPGSPC